MGDESLILPATAPARPTGVEGWVMDSLQARTECHRQVSQTGQTSSCCRMGTCRHMPLSACVQGLANCRAWEAQLAAAEQHGCYAAGSAAALHCRHCLPWRAPLVGRSNMPAA